MELLPGSLPHSEATGAKKHVWLANVKRNLQPVDFAAKNGEKPFSHGSPIYTREIGDSARLGGIEFRFIRINADNTVSVLTATDFKTALSLTAADVGLGNVTNESKTTMFTSPIFTGVAPRLGSPVTDTVATRGNIRSAISTLLSGGIQLSDVAVMNSK